MVIIMQILFGFNIFVNSMEFLNRKTSIKQLKNNIILNFSFPNSLTKCIFLTEIGKNPLNPHMDFSISNAL